jgi:hypothetical protein
LRPHSGYKEQYALLELNGIANTERAYGDRDRLVLVDTDENRQAIQAAIEMLSDEGESSTTKVIDVQARALTISGNFVNPDRHRVRLKKTPKLSYKSIEDMLERLRGASIDE